MEGKVIGARWRALREMGRVCDERAFEIWSLRGLGRRSGWEGVCLLGADLSLSTFLDFFDFTWGRVAVDLSLSRELDSSFLSQNYRTRRSRQASAVSTSSNANGYRRA